MQRGEQGRAARLALGDEGADAEVGEGRIERRHRLVGEDERRPLVEHAGDADALQLAARESIAAIEDPIAEVEPVERVARAGGVARDQQRGERLPRRPGAQAAGENGGDDAQARRDRRALVDDADPRAQPPQRAGAEAPGIVVVDEHATFARPERGAEDADERRLAGARRADHGDALAAGEGERDVAQGALPVRVDEPGAFQAQAVHRASVRAALFAWGRPGALMRRPYLISPAERAADSMPS